MAAVHRRWQIQEHPAAGQGRRARRIGRRRDTAPAVAGSRRDPRHPQWRVQGREPETAPAWCAGALAGTGAGGGEQQNSSIQNAVSPWNRR